MQIKDKNEEDIDIPFSIIQICPACDEEHVKTDHSGYCSASCEILSKFIDPATGKMV